MTAFELLLFHYWVTVLLKWKGMFLINANNKLNACTHWGFTLWCVIKICALETQVWGSVSFLIYDVSRLGLGFGGFFFSIPLTSTHRAACTWALSRCHLNLNRYKTGKYLCFVCFGRFTVSPRLLSLPSWSNRKLPNDQHFVFRGRKTACGRKQTSKISKLLSLRAKPSALRMENRKTLLIAIQACCLYPLPGPLCAGCHHWHHTGVAVQALSVRSLTALLFSSNSIYFSQRI